MYEYLPPLITASAVVVGAFVARHATRFSARLQGSQRACDAEIACIREFSDAFAKAIVATQAYVLNIDEVPRTHHNQADWDGRWVFAQPALEAHAQALWRVGTLPTPALRELARSGLDLLSASMQLDVDKGLAVWHAAMSDEVNPGKLDPATVLIDALAAEQRRLLENYPDDVPRGRKRALRTLRAKSMPELPPTTAN